MPVTFEYAAIRYSQLPSCGDQSTIICLVAPCDEILTWAGIPRKAEAVASDEEEETAYIRLHGYQRESNRIRVEKLVEFYQNPQNVIPTSILLARRFSNLVEFEATGTDLDFGSVSATPGLLRITSNVDRDAPFEMLLQMLCDVLQQRHAELTPTLVDDALVDRYQALFAATEFRGLVQPIASEEVASSERDAAESSMDEGDEDEGNQAAVNPYNPDSHVVDFYTEILLRMRLCQRIPPLNSRQEILGLTRATVLDYLAPVTVVDGQHRLLGALASLDALTESYLGSPSAHELYASGAKSGAELEREFRRSNRRVFSATLMLGDNWVEHVFQFVVVNQKVNKINNALLSSIISTSLTAKEIDTIQNRLEAAGIPTDDYRIMGRLINDRTSPFSGCVKQGFAADAANERIKLDYSVLNTLAKHFRMLSLRPIDRRGPGAINAPRLWRDQHLKRSPYFASHEAATLLAGNDVWEHPVRGLWLDVFVDFWRIARARLADDQNPLARWADPNESNLFNGATMGTIEADFFEFLFEKEIVPNDATDFRAAMDRYFMRMQSAFFGRPWAIQGKRVDRANLILVATYLRAHRTAGSIDGKWNIFPNGTR
jgi:hypothetical protein